jgi:hypothetical protein
MALLKDEALANNPLNTRSFRRSMELTHNREHFELLTKEYRKTDQHHWGIIIAVRHHP